ncbi:MAG TPA: LirA/MavJ family T4SS effector, partial [Myxococcus sp.]|nr:LirA/MavJ family T4SS effector [Myxococcus sp.]
MPLGSETDQKRVREALLGLFPNHGLGKSLLEDCVSFALFLNLPKSDRTHFLSQVALLETALAGRLLDRPDVDVDLLDSDTLKRALRKHGSDARIRLREKRKEKLQEQDGQSSKKGSVFSHLLSEELAENEREWGFQLGDVNGHPKAHLIGPLNGNQFRAQLVNKRPFKDPTIVSDHGEFTHRIQWYLAATAEFFENPVADVYQAVGTVLWQQDPRYGLWDFLCDRNENETYIPWLMPSKPGDADYVLGGEFDFRCAAYLN